MSIPHISCLRMGQPYRSYNESEVKDYRDGSVKATLMKLMLGSFVAISEKLAEHAKPLINFPLKN